MATYCPRCNKHLPKQWRTDIVKDGPFRCSCGAGGAGPADRRRRQEVDNGHRFRHRRKWASRAAGVPVVLQVLEVNPARRLYERLGFLVVAERGNSYEMRFEPAR